MELIKKTEFESEWELEDLIEWAIPEHLQKYTAFPIQQKMKYDRRSNSHELKYNNGINVYVYQTDNGYKVYVYQIG